MTQAPPTPPNEIVRHERLEGDHQLILDVDGDQIIIDASTFDFSDLTQVELAAIADAIHKGPLFDDGEPTPLGVAVFITTKTARGRDWTADQFAAVVELLTSWLTDTLVEV